MQTHNTGVVSSIPSCVTIKTQLSRKAKGSHLIESTSLEKTQSPISGFHHALNRICNAVHRFLAWPPVKVLADAMAAAC